MINPFFFSLLLITFSQAEKESRGKKNLGFLCSGSVYNRIWTDVPDWKWSILAIEQLLCEHDGQLGHPNVELIETWKRPDWGLKSFYWSFLLPFLSLMSSRGVSEWWGVPLSDKLFSPRLLPGAENVGHRLHFANWLNSIWVVLLNPTQSITLTAYGTFQGVGTGGQHFSRAPRKRFQWA